MSPTAMATLLVWGALLISGGGAGICVSFRLTRGQGVSVWALSTGFLCILLAMGVSR